MMNWLKISNNKILFLETDDKYDLFFQPQVIPTILHSFSSFDGQVLGCGVRNV